MHLNTHEIHIWWADLAISDTQKQTKFALLSADERLRAERFHFPIHKKRFIAARSALREILSQYVNIAPQNIVISNKEHEKPFLMDQTLQFNLSHSEDIAVYAFTKQTPVGIDIEKITPNYNPEIVERYFSETEKNAFATLVNEEDKRHAFYRVWARKEAIIKALGHGLSMPLSSFSVSVTSCIETLKLENIDWLLLPLAIHSDFSAAVVSHAPIKSLQFYRFAQTTIQE